MLILKQLARDYNITQIELAKILNTQQSEVSKMINGLREISREHLDRLEAHFGKEVIARYDVTEEQFDAWRSRYARPFTGQILSADIVEEIKEEATEEAKAELLEAESIPVLPAEIATKIGCDVRVYLEENGDELESINPSQLLKRAHLAEKVLKASMMPTFVPDDIVFVRFLQDPTMIIDGETYYIDLKTRPTMIRKVKIEGNTLRLVAQNPSYADIVTTFDDVNNIASIVGLLRMTFADLYSDVDATRRKKDAQIDNLITQHGEALKSISELIAVIKNKN